MSESADQARTRRRWITLAELVAVSGVIIAALTFWMNWSDHRASERDRAVTEEKARAAEARFALRAELTDDGREIRLSDPRHELLETSIAFPAALKLTTRTPATARIERDWFADAVLEATDGGADEREGRLPVLVTATYRIGDATRTGQAVVDLVFRTQGRMIGGRTLTIEAARVRETGGSAARIDALWAAELKRQSERA